MTDPGNERPVTITYLEMVRRTDLTPLEEEPRLVLARAQVAAPELARFLYATVGAQWHWTDRLVWDRERWQSHLERREVQLWLAHLKGTPAGYFELEAQPARQVEVAYLGLLPSFIGQGLGRELLHGAVEAAWAFGAERVWLHTCTLDHPRALPNYQAAGFRVYDSEEVMQAVRGEPPSLWPELT